MKTLKTICESGPTIKHNIRNCTFNTSGGELCYFDCAVTVPVMNSDCLEIQTLVVTNKRKGIGSALVNACKDYANKLGTDIVLCASPLGSSISESDLIKFYTDLGFEQIPELDRSMLIYKHK